MGGRQGERESPRLPRRHLLVLAGLATLTLACPGPSPTEIDRERAVEIARPHVSFTPDSVEVVRTTVDSRAVWQVTFRGRLPGQPPGLFETAVIAVDRVTGEIVSIART